MFTKHFFYLFFISFPIRAAIADTIPAVDFDVTALNIDSINGSLYGGLLSGT